MIFSQKAILALAVVFGAPPSSLVGSAQRDTIDLQELLQHERSSSNLKRVGSKVLIHHPNENPDENDRDRRRRLALSTVVHYPNPCLDLPANRVPDFNETNHPANDGWALAMGPTNDAINFLSLPFTFLFSGDRYSGLYIDVNGELIFPAGHMLYVFYADVDTRGTNGGYVWRRTIGNNKFAVAWDNVGYFNQQTDKLNTFQVLISDGTDASMGLGNNVCYCYGDMQWSTDGVGRVGAEDATGQLGMVLFGEFSQTGAAYDGMYGSNDGFDYLDGKSICFKISGSNIPPVAVNVPENNRVDLDCGKSVANLTLFFLAPEAGQTVSVTTSVASAGLSVAISQQTYQATATINWTPTAAATVNVTLTASDGIDSTTVSLTFTSPGPCCQHATAEIWNPTKNKFVQTLVNGSKYCLKKYNFRAVPCQTEPIWMKLVNTKTRITLKRQKDFVPPYFLWGSRTVNATTGYVDVKPNPKALPNGRYAFRISAINATSNATSSYTEIRFKQACP